MVKWSEAVGVVVTVDPSIVYVEGQLVSGPGGSVFGYADPYAGILIQNLTPNSSYTVRFRSWAPTSSGRVYSDYATFAFRTPTIEQSRPSTPVINFSGSGATFVDVSWPPSTDNSVGVAASAAYVRYRYSVNGGPFQGVCSGGYCTGGETSVRLSRITAPSGSTIVVKAVDAFNIESQPSNVLVVP